MGITHVVTAVSVFLTGLLPSCHKAATQTKAAPVVASVNATNGPQHDLGELALTNHFETCVKLGNGKNCTFTPRMIDSKTVELTLSMETRTQSGQIHDVSVAQVTTRSGKPVEVAVGDYQLSLTPKVISE